MDVAEPPSDAPGLDTTGLPPAVRVALDALQEATDVLCGIDLTQLEGQAALSLVHRLAAGASRLECLKVRALPVVEEDGLWATGGARSFGNWVAREHRLPSHTAHAQVRLGRTLRDALPLTAQAALSGDITLSHAQILATLAPTTPQRCEVLADPDNECNEAFLVREARTRSVDDLRILARHWARVFDPDADDRGYVEACDRESLQLSRLRDGYHLVGWLTVPHGQALKAALEAATPVPAADDERTSDQRRAQALADVAQLALDRTATGSGRTSRPRLSVLVGHAEFTAIAAAACRPASAQPGRAGTPARTPGYGTVAMLTGETDDGVPQYEDGTPVPRAVLDRIACDSEIQRIVFGPASQVLDVGRAERTFTGPRRAAIIARDKHCRYPTCSAPPVLSDAHHVRHWARDHGTTSVDNGILLCWYHHDLVHRRHIEIHRRRGRWVFVDAHGDEIGTDHDPVPPA
jgi:hypothetical protein